MPVLYAQICIKLYILHALLRLCVCNSHCQFLTITAHTAFTFPAQRHITVLTTTARNFSNEFRHTNYYCILSHIWAGAHAETIVEARITEDSMPQIKTTSQFLDCLELWLSAWHIQHFFEKPEKTSTILKILNRNRGECQCFLQSNHGVVSYCRIPKAYNKN